MSVARINNVQRESQRATYWFAAWLGDTAQIKINSEEKESTSERSSFAAARLHLPRARLADSEAAIAHYYAHRHYGVDKFAVGGLKPIQIILTSLFEDARVEQMAMRARPGLRNLWSPYIDALDYSGNDIPALLRRLSAALFDPVWHDPHPWVDKARRLFIQHSLHARRDANASRNLGNLLGNDLGQMRLQFNWKGYVVEPCYRDDHRGLWVEESEPHQIENRPATIRFDAQGDSVAQLPMGSDDNVSSSEMGKWLAASPPIATAIKTLPEWDYAREFYREHWVQVSEQVAVDGTSAAAENLPRHWATHRSALKELMASLDHQRHQIMQRLRRLDQGDDLDLDVCINFLVEQRAGYLQSPHVYRQRSFRQSPRSLVILIDASLSSGDELAASLSVLDCARMAALSLLNAAERCGDQVAVYAFCSDGRLALRITPIKLFSEKFNDETLTRLVGLHSAFSTRLGAALRYAHHVLLEKSSAGNAAAPNEILILTDGEASDIDCGDPAYLGEDARHAVAQMRAENIEVSAVAFLRNSSPPEEKYENAVGAVLHPLREVFGKSAKLFSFR